MDGHPDLVQATPHPHHGRHPLILPSLLVGLKRTNGKAHHWSMLDLGPPFTEPCIEGLWSIEV